MIRENSNCWILLSILLSILPMILLSIGKLLIFYTHKPDVLLILNLGQGRLFLNMVQLNFTQNSVRHKYFTLRNLEG